MNKYFCLLFLAVLAVCRDYPHYNQCDTKWKDQKLGNSTSTICQAGAMISAVSIGLSGVGINYNPSTLNTWLKNNKGYANKSDYVWTAVNTLGVTFEGKIPNTLLRINLDVGYLVVINVNKGAHWVLATGYSGTAINVVDSLHPEIKTYDISTVVSGNSGVYKTYNTFSLSNLIVDLQNKYLQSQEEEKE